MTGGAGFVGRNMIKALRARREPMQIISVDLEGMWVDYDLTHPASHLHLIQDIHRHLRARSTQSDRFDLVIHCAYHVGGRAAIDSSKTNLAKNVALDAALFDWAVATGQPRVLYFSSPSAYPTWMQQEGRFQEVMREQSVAGLMEHFAGGGEPDADYGWAKLTGERLATNAKNASVNVHIVRPFSGYGADQSEDYPFPAILARVKAGDLSVWGPPGQTRDWIHIDDVCEGALAVVDADFQEPVNLCTGRGVEMGELARTMWHIINTSDTCSTECDHGDAPKVVYDESKPTGVMYRVGDPTLMNTIYTAKISLEEGIRRALQ